MGYDNVNLAALIGSRICHDLISPIGAISNGLELLGMSGIADGPELGLITDSAENAGARIRFFRIAFGASGNEMLGRAETVAVLRDMLHGGRISVEWGPLDAQPRSDVRLAFLSLLCCETALAYGGTVRITADQGAWTITAHARKLRADPALWTDLTAGTRTAEITPALVQFALLPALASDQGRELTATHSETQVQIRF